MVMWPTLGSRTAKEQNGTGRRMNRIESGQKLFFVPPLCANQYTTGYVATSRSESGSATLLPFFFFFFFLETGATRLLPVLWFRSHAVFSRSSGESCTGGSARRVIYTTASIPGH